MAKLLLAGGTNDAASSTHFRVGSNVTATATIVGTAAAGDKIHLEYSPDQGANWHKIRENGADRDLDYNNHVQLIRGPVLARVRRPSGNTGNIGASLATEQSP